MSHQHRSCRRMMKISCVGKVENEKILGKGREERQVIKRITEKQLKLLAVVSKS